MSITGIEVIVGAWQMALDTGIPLEEVVPLSQGIYAVVKVGVYAGASVGTEGRKKTG